MWARRVASYCYGNGKLIKTPILAVAAALMLSGCASSGIIGKQALSQTITPGKARLVIYRSSALGGLTQPNYLIDGRNVGASQPSGFVSCELSPGPHKISVANSALNIQLGSGTDKAQINLAPDRTTYIKASSSFGLTVGVITIEPVSPSTGASDTAGLHKIESAC